MWNSLCVDNLRSADVGVRLRACEGLMKLVDSKAPVFVFITRPEHTSIMKGKPPFISMPGRVPLDVPFLGWDDGEPYPEDSLECVPYTLEELDRIGTSLRGKTVKRKADDYTGKIIGHRLSDPCIVLESCANRWVTVWTAEALVQHFVYEDTGKPVGICREPEWIEW